jgi:hypothetical protein
MFVGGNPMPLRDHFRPPVSSRTSWEGFHAVWPVVMLQQLRGKLPPGFLAEPRVHLGAPYEIDVSTDESDGPADFPASVEGGAVATLPWTTRPTVSVETETAGEYEYALRVYDVERERTLVAAVEIVSPANKDRPRHRMAFVAKCAEMIRRGVAVSVIDLVTVKRFNLYAELMDFLGHPTDDPMCADPPPAYAASCRWVERQSKVFLETWSHALKVNEPLPSLPLWLSAGRSVPLHLEDSYEKACQDLSIP